MNDAQATITVPAVAAELVAESVIRFLPCDGAVECEYCGGHGVRTLSSGDMGDCSYCDMSGRRPLRPGDRINIMAGDELPTEIHSVGDWIVDRCVSGWFVAQFDSDVPGTLLRPGEVVATATVAHVLPIVGEDDDCRGSNRRVIHHRQGQLVWVECNAEGEWWNTTDISDHLGYGLTFTPGHTAIELADVEPAPPPNT